MSITVTERCTSRPLTDGKSHVRIYVVTGTSDEAEAMTALKAAAPSVANSLIRDVCEVEPDFIDTENPSHCRWIGRAPYISTEDKAGEEREPIALNGIVIQGTTGGGTMHRTHSIHTNSSRGRYAVPDPAVAPDFQQGIGWNGEEFEGVDVGVRQFEFTIIKVWEVPGDLILDTLYNLSWTVNNAEVTYTDTETGIHITLAAGECLFKWADFGRSRGDGGLEVVYHMAASPNIADGEVKISDTDVPAKLGWKYVWTYCVPRKDDASDRVISTMEAIYVEQVYEIADHSGLAI